MSWKKDIEEIKKRESFALNHGGEESVRIQHEKGRKTLRERLDIILDKDTFDEVGKISGSPIYNDKGIIGRTTSGNFSTWVWKNK